MLGSHLHSCKERRGGGGSRGGMRKGGLGPNARFVLWGLRLPPALPHSLRDIQYRNCKFDIKRVKSQMHMSQQCHKVNLLSSISARTSTLYVSVGGRLGDGAGGRNYGN